ncbi:Insulin protein enhancer protein isl-1, partial [Periplaneta americana]
KRRLSLCVGCGAQIHDQYILRVAPDLEWHAACLKCAECHQFLDETCTCFVRDGKTYCKRDYVSFPGSPFPAVSDVTQDGYTVEFPRRKVNN